MKIKAVPSILVFTFILLFSLSLAGYALAQKKPKQYEGGAQRPPAVYTKPLPKQTLPRPQPPKVTYFKINGDFPFTYYRTVTLDNKTERASQYRASQNSNFNEAQWKVLNIRANPINSPEPYGNSHPNFDLIGDVGYKTVYFQVRDQIGQVSDVHYDTIRLENQ